MNRTALFATLALSPILLAAHTIPASTGTWAINGDVQGTPVQMTCVLTEAEADHTLTGNCTGAAGDQTPRKLTGEVKDKAVKWHFDTVYQENPITVSMTGTLSDDGTHITGTMYVDPMAVDGTFAATRQTAKDPAPTAAQ
jgi:alpha-ketoglutarate-dependent taurine dioxygenase